MSEGEDEVIEIEATKRPIPIFYTSAKIDVPAMARVIAERSDARVSAAWAEVWLSVDPTDRARTQIGSIIFVHPDDAEELMAKNPGSRRLEETEEKEASHFLDKY